jgi:hypothetical protein
LALKLNMGWKHNEREPKLPPYWQRR